MPFEGPLLPERETPTIAPPQRIAFPFPPRVDFVRWLESQPPETVVARCWGASTCPLANWIKATSDVEHVYINPGYYYIIDLDCYYFDRIQHQQVLPHWAQSFVLHIDSINPSIRMIIGITAEDCLRVLAKIPDRNKWMKIAKQRS